MKLAISRSLISARRYCSDQGHETKAAAREDNNRVRGWPCELCATPCGSTGGRLAGEARGAGAHTGARAGPGTGAFPEVATPVAFSGSSRPSGLGCERGVGEGLVTQRDRRRCRRPHPPGPAAPAPVSTHGDACAAQRGVPGPAGGRPVWKDAPRNAGPAPSGPSELARGVSTRRTCLRDAGPEGRS